MITQWLLGSQNLWLQAKPKSFPVHHRAASWYEVFVLICCVWSLLVSSVQNALFQKSCALFR